MLRVSLIALTLFCVAVFAQSPDVRERIAAHQNLIRELNESAARYTKNHPGAAESLLFVNLLEAQVRLLQQPREAWNPAAVQLQIQAITAQLSARRNQVARYTLAHPSTARDRSIIELLEGDLQGLQSR